MCSTLLNSHQGESSDGYEILNFKVLGSGAVCALLPHEQFSQLQLSFSETLVAHIIFHFKIQQTVSLLRDLPIRIFFRALEGAVFISHFFLHLLYNRNVARRVSQVNPFFSFLDPSSFCCPSCSTLSVGIVLCVTLLVLCCSSHLCSCILSSSSSLFFSSVSSLVHVSTSLLFFSSPRLSFFLFFSSSLIHIVLRSFLLSFSLLSFLFFVSCLLVFCSLSVLLYSSSTSPLSSCLVLSPLLASGPLDAALVLAFYSCACKAHSVSLCTMFATMSWFLLVHVFAWISFARALQESSANLTLKAWSMGGRGTGGHDDTKWRGHLQS